MTEEQPQVPAAEPPKTEPKPEEHMIPKNRFDEVNNRAKEAEARLAALETEKAEAEKKALEESGKFKELYEKEQAEKARLENEVLKRDLIQDAINTKKLHPSLSKMVIGTTKEEIAKSIEEAIVYQEDFAKQLKDGTLALDNSGGGKPTPKTPISQAEWIALHDKDPKEADRILKEMTDAANKQ